jgi:glycine/D-amino acid oxidase-like deaminating enzyme
MAIDTPARIAILGAGPIGLEAALYARYLGYTVDVYERGRVAENVLAWGHVRMFTPFGQNRSPLGIAALRAQDPAWQPPAEDATLTGREYAERYLIPLAQSDLLADGLHEHTRVVSVGRQGPLKGELAGADERIDTDFRLLVAQRDAAGHLHERVATADAVIDATGVYGLHNWLGSGGVPALGERAAEAHIEYGLPDVHGSQYERYASRATLLVGDGDSAASTLVSLAKLAATTPDTWITWATRGMPQPGQPGPLRIDPDDPYAERARLFRQANSLAAGDANHVTHLPGTVVESIVWHADLERFVVRFAGEHAEEMEFHRVIANVGYRPDVSIYEELQVDTYGVTGAPKLGEPGAICTTEPDFYVLGAKSRGRDSRFTLSEGFEQIRALFAVIGDRADLDLYSTMNKLAEASLQDETD